MEIRKCWVGLVAAGIIALAAHTTPAQSRASLGSPLPERWKADLPGGVKMEFVLVRPGTVAMGSEKGEDDEKPIHKVTFNRPFYMGQQEVTQAQWKAIMGENPSNFKGDDLPVENVSWTDCQAYLLKLQEKLPGGVIGRLPSEAEWEYACRAGGTKEFSEGDDGTCIADYAWTVVNSEHKTHRGASKKANKWGLYDMHGNVWEWCEDWYDERYYENSPPNNPQGPPEGDRRIIRGGSWGYFPEWGRAAYRNWSSPDVRHSDVGFRIVCEVR